MPLAGGSRDLTKSMANWRDGVRVVGVVCAGEIPGDTGNI